MCGNLQIEDNLPLGSVFHGQIWLVADDVVDVQDANGRQLGQEIVLRKKNYFPDHRHNFRISVQGYPLGQRLFIVDFDLGVPPCFLYSLPILPDLQLPKQNKADIFTTKSKSTKCKEKN